MKIWLDDVRPAPDGYVWVKTVNKAKQLISRYYDWLDWDNNSVNCIEIIDMDHDAGEYASQGGDYIKLLDWLEEEGYNCPIHIHSMNPVGIENMKRIIDRNGWQYR